MRIRETLAALVIGVFCFAAHASADTLSLTAGSNATTTPNVATAITGFQIVGSASVTTPVKIRSTSGNLTLSVVSGVTMSGNGSRTVTLSGTVEKLNQALSTLTYTRATTGTDTLEVALVESGEVFFENNGHLYKFISGSINATAARAAAANQTAYGSTGYLATITSQLENDFVAARLQGDGWIGGSDEGTEGVWKWVTGPESGTTFWNGAWGGSAPVGQYANWSNDEPNDWSNGNPGEDCVQFYITSTKWNDLHCTQNNLSGYVVEFGADGDMPTVVAQNIAIVTADVPAVTSLTPSNGATNVSAGADLVIGFSKSVTNETGNILIKKTSDDSVVDTISAAGDQVSGSGTNSITITPSASLEEGVQYYVIVPGTAFKDASNNFFDGISEDSTWVFTTSDETAPILSSIAASTIATTTATIAWTSNEMASTKVVYSTGDSFASTTSETDTSSRVTSHSSELSNLTGCTTYNFKVVSADGAGNYATSSAQSFTTLGCTSFAVPLTATTTSVAVNSAASSTLTESGRSMMVQTPEDFTATSSTVVIQIKSMEADTVLATLGTPTSLLQGANIVFDVKALINGSVELDSFDHPVTMTYSYTDEDISGLDESSLWMYHYHDEVWEALDDCSVDEVENTVTCTTPNFSVFGIFGSSAPSADSSGRGSKGSSIQARVANLTRLGNVAAAQELKSEWPRLFATSTDDSATTHVVGVSVPAQDLEYGMTGNEVVKLQEILISRGYAIPAGATGYFGVQTRSALAAYQTQNVITPSLGYFGPKTRARMMQSLN